MPGASRRRRQALHARRSLGNPGGARGDPGRRRHQLAAAAACSPASARRTICGAVGVPVAHDLPGVGRDLQDHLEFYFQVACREPVTLLDAMRPHNMVRDRTALVPVPRRAGGELAPRGRRLHPLGPGHAPSGHPVPLPAGAGRGPRPLQGPDARLPGPCRHHAAREPRLAGAALGRPDASTR